MRISTLLAPVAIAVAQPAAAQEPVPALTREQAMTLPPEQIAEIVFRQLAGRMAAMSRPNFVGLFFPPGGLRGLTFATAPRATHSAGLCEATRLEIAFSGDGEGGARATDLTTSSVYKVIGELGQGVERTEEDQAQLDERCARAGPVIAAGTGDLGAQTFFSFHGDNHPFAALAALQQAISAARAGTYRNVECQANAAVAGGAPTCDEVLGQFRALDLSHLLHVTVARLDQGDARYRIEARFLIDGGANYQIYWTVLLDVAHLHSARMELGRGRISRNHAVIE